MPRRHGLLARPGPLHPVGGSIRLLAVLLLALIMVAAPVPAPAAAQESLPATSTSRSVPGTQLCPEVMVLATRGAPGGQAPSPTRYSLQGPWMSNGYEDDTIRAFLQQAEVTHGQVNGGESLMRDVLVRGLEPWHYPPSESGAPSRDTGNTSEAVLQTILLANRLAHPLTQTLTATAETLRGGGEVQTTGGEGTDRAIRDFESTTGCRPDYILIGSREGATELARLERPLAEQGRLTGVLYFGAQQPATQDPDAREGAGNLLRELTQSRRDPEPESTGSRLNYCLPADTACGDPTAPQDGPAVQYTRWDSPADRKIMQAFASWVDGSRD